MAIDIRRIPVSLIIQTDNPASRASLRPVRVGNRLPRSIMPAPESIRVRISSQTSGTWSSPAQVQPSSAVKDPAAWSP
ncbi:hypothetical protein CMUS01_06492 [Colletotrichum musicola]|uniref:Uncharacterized protein n=1 Tax=Colletotrichum musicola TaxID=2175873 RepID=A0A8H6KLS3_9PEZI|nr:hypothetical protein CMUS01_06492 [Colletotrichum musicola]